MVINYMYAALELYPDANWRYSVLSSDKSVPFWFIKKHMTKPWSWVNVSGRFDIELEFVVNNRDLHWSYEALSLNLSIPMDAIIGNLRSDQPLPWDLLLVVGREDFDLRFVNDSNCIGWPRDSISALMKSEHDLINYPQIKWVEACLDLSMVSIDTVVKTSSWIDWNLIDVASMCTFTEAQFERHVDVLQWQAEHLLDNPSLTLHLFVRYHDLFEASWKGYYDCAARCMKLTIADLYQYKQLFESRGWFKWSDLSMNSSICIDDKISNMLGPQPLPWSKIGLLQCVHTVRSVEFFGEDNVDWTCTCAPDVEDIEDVVMTYKHKDWPWHLMHERKWFTWSHAIRLKDKPLNWVAVRRLSTKPTIDELKQLTDVPINWRYLSVNTNLTFSDIISNPTLPWSIHICLHEDATYEGLLALLPHDDQRAIVDSQPKFVAERLLHKKGVMLDVYKSCKYRRSIKLRHIDRTMKRWRRKTITNRAYFKNHYDHVVDVLKLRLRDHALGLTRSITSPAK